VSFGYRIMAVRRNYENVRFADLTHDMDKMKQMRERMKAPGAKPVSHDPTRKAMPVAAKTASPAPSPEVRR